VFLATNAPEPKPATEALIKTLLAKEQQAASDQSKAPDRVANAPVAKKEADRSRF